MRTRRWRRSISSGQAYESLARESAYAAYLSALVGGDSSNRYASQAQSRLQVWATRRQEVREQVLRSLVPHAGEGAAGAFTDVTSVAG